MTRADLPVSTTKLAEWLCLHLRRWRLVDPAPDPFVLHLALGGRLDGDDPVDALLGVLNEQGHTVRADAAELRRGWEALSSGLTPSQLLTPTPEQMSLETFVLSLWSRLDGDPGDAERAGRLRSLTEAIEEQIATVAARGANATLDALVALWRERLDPRDDDDEVRATLVETAYDGELEPPPPEEALRAALTMLGTRVNEWVPTLAWRFDGQRERLQEALGAHAVASRAWWDPANVPLPDEVFGAVVEVVRAHRTLPHLSDAALSSIVRQVYGPPVDPALVGRLPLA